MMPPISSPSAWRPSRATSRTRKTSTTPWKAPRSTARVGRCRCHPHTRSSTTSTCARSRAARTRWSVSRSSSSRIRAPAAKWVENRSDWRIAKKETNPIRYSPFRYTLKYMDIAGLLAQLLNGLQYGLLLFLIASGLTLVFGVMGIINLAHGSLFMVGAYTAFIITSATGSLWIALPAGIAGGIVLGILLERFLFRHFYEREHLDQVLLTFALILLFEEGRSLLVGNDFYSVPIPAALDFSIPITEGFSYSAYRFAVIGICLLVALAMFLWIERTRLGAKIRAAAEKPEMVDVLGIDARRIHLTVFAVGTALALAAGVPASPLYSVYPILGDGFLIISFVVVVIGGLGSVSGAFWSALLIGLVDTLGKAYLPVVAGLSVYVLMAAVLLWRPSGLFGPRSS